MSAVFTVMILPHCIRIFVTVNELPDITLPIYEVSFLSLGYLSIYTADDPVRWAATQISRQ